MCWSFLLLLFSFNSLSGVNGDVITCTEENPCFAESKACADGEPCVLNCINSHACRGMRLICANNQMCLIYCLGDESCLFLSVEGGYDAYTEVNVNGDRAWANSDFHGWGSNSHTRISIAQGTHGLQDARVSCDGICEVFAIGGEDVTDALEVLEDELSLPMEVRGSC